MHWADRAKCVRYLRQAAFVVGKEKGVKFDVPVDIIVEPIQKSKTAADADAFHPAVKAIIDGFVDAKVIENDSPKFLKSIKYLSPKVGTVSGVKVWISYERGTDEA